MLPDTKAKQTTAGSGVISAEAQKARQALFVGKTAAPDPSVQHYIKTVPQNPYNPPLPDQGPSILPTNQQNWEYRNAVAGPQGQQLPPLATAWDPKGNPFFGEGLVGAMRKYASAWQQATARTGETPMTFGEYVSGALGALSAGVKATVQLPLDVAVMGGQQLEQQFMGRARALQEAAPNSPLPQIKALEQTPMPQGTAGAAEAMASGEKSAGWTPATSMMTPTGSTPEMARGLITGWANWGENMLKDLLATGPIAAYNALRVYTSPGTFQEHLSELNALQQASRIEYSAAMDPMLRDNFLKRVQNGENPAIIAIDLAMPGPEAIGQALLDPLNVIMGGARVAKEAEYAATAGEMVAKTSPDIAKAMEDVATAQKAGTGLAESLKNANVLVEAFDARLAAERAAQEAQTGIFKSIFRYTAEGRRKLAGDMAADIIGWISTNHPKDADALASAIEALAKTASADAKVRAEGLAHLISEFPAAQPFFSRAGRNTAQILFDTLKDEKGVINGEKFLKGAEEALKSTDPAAVVKWASGKLEPALAKSMPSLEDALNAADKAKALEAAGKEVPADIKALAQFAPEGGRATLTRIEKVMQSKFYRPVNRVFSAMYMGYSPGYAMRNGIQNTVHALVDEGFAGVKNLFNPSAATEDSARWLGGMVSTAESRGLKTIAAGTMPPIEEGAGAIRKLIDRPAQRLSELFEQSASKNIYHASVERTMRAMLKDGRALPDVRPLIEAGMSEDTARVLGNLVVEHRGDVHAAADAVRQALGAGKIEAWTMLPEFLAKGDLNSLEKMGFRGMVEDAVAKAKLDGTGVEGAVANVQETLKGIRAQAERAAFEHATVTADAAGAVAQDSQILGRLTRDDLAHATIDDMMVANANTAGVVQNTSQHIMEDAALAAEPDPAMMAAVRQVTDKYAFLSKGDNSFWTWVDATRNAQVAPMKDTLDTLKGKSFAQEQLIKMWTDAGITGKAPEVLSAQVLKDELFKVIQDQSYEFYNGARDMLFKGETDMIAELQALGVPVNARHIAEAEQSVQYARDVSMAAVLKDGRMYSWNAVAGPLVEGIKSPYQLLEAINKYLPEGVKPFEKLSDVPLKVAQDALTGRKTALASLAGTANAQMVHVYRGSPLGSVEGGHNQWWSQDRSYAETIGGPKISEMDVPKDVWDQAVAEADAIRAKSGGPVVPPEMRGIEGQLPEGYKPPEVPAVTLKPVVPPHAQDTAPTIGRALHEQLPDTEALFQRTIDQLNAAKGKTIDVISETKAEAALAAWEKEAAARVSVARLTASQVATQARDFALHNYGAKYGFDAAIGHLFPYHFWYTRTYVKWAERIAMDPVILANYARYRKTMEQIHAGQPEWWRYNVSTDDLLGIQTDHPIYFNLEATLNPLNGLTGVDFNDPNKRVDWFTSTMDSLGKFGPSVWTPISLAIATGLYMNGQQDAAARWAGRLIPQTSIANQIITKFTGKPIELDPMVNAFSGGIDPYTRNRIGRALGAMVQEGLVTQEQAIEASRTQSGQVWDAARVRESGERLPGTVASFVFGAGLRMRTRSDMTIDQFYSDYNLMWANRPNMSPDKFRQSMDALRNQYPFMDSLLLSRKSGPQRDAAYAYNVMSRIPPSQTSDYASWAGIDPTLLSKFYDSKGDMTGWAPTDQQKFNAGMADIGALLALPNSATRTEWNQAKSAYSQMTSEIEATYGKDITAAVDAYYAARSADPAKGDAMLKANPDISNALDFKAQWVMTHPLLQKYYGSLKSVEGYLKSVMYAGIEAQVGSDIWDKWATYDAMKKNGENYKAYWSAHPELGKYLDLRDAYQSTLAKNIVAFGEKIGNEQAQLTTDQAQSTGQAAILKGRAAQEPALPQLTPEQWQQTLGPNLSRLVQDEIYGGKALPKSALTLLDGIATDMGLPSAQVIVELVKSAGAGQVITQQ